MQIIIVWNKHWLKNTVNNSYLKGRYLKIVYWLERIDAGYLTILETEQQFPDHKNTKIHLGGNPVAVSSRQQLYIIMVMLGPGRYSMERDVRDNEMWGMGRLGSGSVDSVTVSLFAF